MKRNITVTKNESKKSLIARAKEKIVKKYNSVKGFVTATTLAYMTGYVNVYATDANSAWNSTMSSVEPWIKRIGLVLIVFGGIEFAIANNNEDAQQKTRATRFMVSGAIVVAVVEALWPMLTA